MIEQPTANVSCICRTTLRVDCPVHGSPSPKPTANGRCAECGNTKDQHDNPEEFVPMEQPSSNRLLDDIRSVLGSCQGALRGILDVAPSSVTAREILWDVDRIMTRIDANKRAADELAGGAYRPRRFWSPDRRYLVAAHKQSDGVVLIDDNGRLWEQSGSAEPIGDAATAVGAESTAALSRLPRYTLGDSGVAELKANAERLGVTAEPPARMRFKEWWPTFMKDHPRVPSAAHAYEESIALHAWTAARHALPPAAAPCGCPYVAGEQKMIRHRAECAAAKPPAAHRFERCDFMGEPPEGFCDWNEWASQTVLRDAVLKAKAPETKPAAPVLVCTCGASGRTPASTPHDRTCPQAEPADETTAPEPDIAVQHMMERDT